MLANSASKCGNMGGQWKGVKFLYLLCYILKRSPREKLTSLVVPKKSQLGKALKYQKYMGHISISYYLRTSKDLRSPWKSAFSKCYDMILSWDSKVTWTLGGTSPFTARAGARFSLFTAVTAMFVTMASILICLVSEPPTNLEDWSNPYHKNDKTYQASQNLHSIIINRTFWIYQTPHPWIFLGAPRYIYSASLSEKTSMTLVSGLLESKWHHLLSDEKISGSKIIPKWATKKTLSTFHWILVG